MALVALFPVVYAFVISLQDYTGRQREGFAGFDNYVEALTDDRFWTSLQFTFVFTITSVAAEFLIGLGFALLMNQAFRGRGVTRASILVPWVIPTVIAAQMWFFMFNVTPGFINSVFGLGDFSWLGQSGWASFAIIFADVWKTAPFVALLLLAGLQTIPGDVYEGARVDGAGMFQRFWFITLPLLKPAILVALIFRTLDALRIFDLPYVLTQGANGTTTLSLIAQQELTANRLIGLGSALSVLTFVIVMAVAFIYIRTVGGNIRALAEEN
jgi:ABC-type sugar transport system permease subunit